MGAYSRDSSPRESVWVRAPFASRQDAMVTRPVDLPPAAADEMMRIARFGLVALQELRGPIAAASASLARLQETPGVPVDPGEAQLLADAARNLALLRRRTDDMLEIAQVRAGLSRLRPTEVDPAELVRRAAEEFGSPAQCAGVRLTVTCEPRLPRLQGDERRLMEVLRHFTRNAIEYAPSGGRIDLRSSRRGDTILLEVQDYGPGIDPQRRMAELESDYREELQFGEVAGMGIGLELCKILVEQHGGKIELITEKGKGSLFRAAIPITPRQFDLLR
jgi:signal transduction histidine kinase